MLPSPRPILFDNSDAMNHSVSIFSRVKENELNVFVTKKDAADGISISDVKYAPYAIMNAVYVTGRNEIAGNDNGQFCAIWAGN